MSDGISLADILRDDVAMLGAFTYPAWGQPPVTGPRGHHAECLPFIQVPFDLFASNLMEPGGCGNMQGTSYSKETGKVATNKERWLDNRIYAWYSSNNPAYRTKCIAAVSIEAKYFLAGWSDAHDALIRAKMEYLHRLGSHGLIDLTIASNECPVRLHSDRPADM